MCVPSRRRSLIHSQLAHSHSCHCPTAGTSSQPSGATRLLPPTRCRLLALRRSHARSVSVCWCLCPAARGVPHAALCCCVLCFHCCRRTPQVQTLRARIRSGISNLSPPLPDEVVNALNAQQEVAAHAVAVKHLQEVGGVGSVQDRCMVLVGLRLAVLGGGAHQHARPGPAGQQHLAPWLVQASW